MYILNMLFQKPLFNESLVTFSALVFWLTKVHSQNMIFDLSLVTSLKGVTIHANGFSFSVQSAMFFDQMLGQEINIRTFFFAQITSPL